jgi:predicted metal-dependent phosphoesterase TrpH
MRIDLHTHSNRSDGTDTPTELVENAKATGLDVVALTDHDHTSGWDEAQIAADRVGIRLVRGIEISTKLEHRSIHLLGYDFDPDHPGLTAELDRVLDGRGNRLPRLLDRLRELGVDLTMDEVLEHAPSATESGRPHVADAMVAKGYVSDRTEAFDRYLADGGIAHIARYSAPLYDAVRLLKQAGGKAVVAHAWARSSRPVMTPEVFSDLVDLGLDGIEVNHVDHDEKARRELAGIATDLGLVITGSSDYHGTGKSSDFHLGANTTDPDQFERLIG